VRKHSWIPYHVTTHNGVGSFRVEFAKGGPRGAAHPKGFPAPIDKVARRKLVPVNNAQMLADPAAALQNYLEAVKFKLAGKYLIHINDRWRLVFCWTDDGSEEVEIMNDHRG
jgi:toxin HigB-1